MVICGRDIMILILFILHPTGITTTIPGIGIGGLMVRGDMIPGIIQHGVCILVFIILVIIITGITMIPIGISTMDIILPNP